MPNPKSLPDLPEDYTSKFFYNDVVTRETDTNFRGQILRCWAEEEDMPDDEQLGPDSLDRPLLRGEVGVRNMRTDERTILPESSLTLFHRDFELGDLVKRSLSSVESAIVLDIKREVKLEQLATKKRIDEWIPFDRVKCHMGIELADRVVYDHWIGTITNIGRTVLIERKKEKELVRVHDLDGVLEPGRVLEDQRAPPTVSLPAGPADAKDLVLSSHVAKVRVTWNAIDQKLPVSEQERHPKPKADWTWEDIPKLAHFSLLHEQSVVLGQGVVFKDPEDEKKYGVEPTSHTGKLVTHNLKGERSKLHGREITRTLRSLKVVEARSKITLLWQDGSKTEEWASGFILYRKFDDYEMSPGDHVHCRGDNDTRRTAVIQSGNPHQRIVDLVFDDTGERQTVSILDVDCLASSDNATCGVAVGDTVLLCEDNGAPEPEVPDIGEFANTPWNDWTSSNTNDPTAVKFCELADLVDDPDKPYEGIKTADESGTNWWGRAISANVDGTISVRLPGGDIKIVKTKNVYSLRPSQDEMAMDGLPMPFGPPGPLGPLPPGTQPPLGVVSMNGNGVSLLMNQLFNDASATGIPGGNFMGAGNLSTSGDEPMNENRDAGRWRGMTGAWDESEEETDAEREQLDSMLMALAGGRMGGDSISGPFTGGPMAFGHGPFDTDEDMTDTDDGSSEEDEEMEKGNEVQAGQEEDEEGRDAQEAEKMITDELVNADVPPPLPTKAVGLNGTLDVDESMNEAGPSKSRGVSGILADDDDARWQSFEVLDEAPADHHFFGKTIDNPSKAYLKRIAKEHKALRSSLPENILVRTYENRTDLLRCLIIGPEGTPYANAPFVFDIYLDPIHFPHEPPAVHFYSHTNGQGRCNPNLYEEGKVCLSILGTWSGDASESWNPRTSSLLQVLVSISGLVLVRSPYHCEPAFAKLEGTKEGRVNSRHYSEKAYVLSRSFVKTALQTPPTGLQDAIRYLYYDTGRLQEVINHAKRLMEKSEAGEVEDENAQMWNADAMGSLTLGASLSLKRPISALERLLEEHRQSSKV